MKFIKDDNFEATPGEAAPSATVFFCHFSRSQFNRSRDLLQHQAMTDSLSETSIHSASQAQFS
jgi:hypothetical protein